MLKNGKFKFITSIFTLAMTILLFAGCSSNTKNSPDTNKTIKVNITANPKTLDPGLSNTLEGSIVISNSFEGLVDLDKDDKPTPGVAEKWEVSQDGLTYTFHLRKDAKWSDGKPVKAQDFEYAWKRALDPKTASAIAYKLYYLKNGQSFNSNKTTSDQVGVKVIDDYTLQVNLEAPTPYFTSLLATSTYDPIRKDIVEKNPKDWATNPETYVSNGPFKMTEYKIKDSLNFVKNPNYWDCKNVKLNRIEYKTIENENSYYAAFKTGQLDLIIAPPMAETPQLLKDGTAKAFPYMATYFYNFNVSGKNLSPEAAKALKDVRVRKALSLAIDREAITSKVTQGGQVPATSLVPSSLTDTTGNKFKNKDYFNKTANIEEAKKLLAEAGYSNGKNFPKLEILYNTMQGHKIIAEAVQDMWKKNLGVDVTLRNVERQVQITEAVNKNYSICRGGLVGEYNDPMTFLDVFTSANKSNYAGYNNPKYDALITAVKVEANIEKRTGMLHEAEDLLMEDMPIMSIYEYTEVVCMNKKLKGVQVSPLGFFFFKNADIQK